MQSKIETRKPQLRQKASIIRRPPRKPPLAATGGEDQPKRAYVFQFNMTGIPGILAVSLVAKSKREAAAIAYLLTDGATEHLQKALA